MRRTRVLLVTAALVLGGAEKVAASVCGAFDGSFVSVFDSDLPGPPYPPGYMSRCPTSTLFPVRQCTHGKLFDTSGAHMADYEFGFTSQRPAADGTLRFTGVSDITLVTGERIHGRDHGYLRPDPRADGQIASFETTVEPYAITRPDGTVKRLRTAADTPGNPDDVSLIVAGPGGTGRLDALRGTASGAYVGKLCPKP